MEAPGHDRKYNILSSSASKKSNKSLLKRVSRRINRLFQEHLNPDFQYEKQLDVIGRHFSDYPSFSNNESKLKILFGPSFCIYPPSFIHDRLYAYALRLRDATIIPIYCNGVQSVECNFYGGVWKKGDLPDNCKNCINISERLWKDNPVHPIKFSDYLSKDDISIISEKIESLNSEEWVDYSEDGMPVGGWARDILVNNYVVGDYHLIPDHERLGRVHLKNLLIVKRVYEKIIEKVKPDRVFTNDSYYGMWIILQKICEKKHIPFYSHWIGTRQNAWCYAYNDAAMRLDFSVPWKKFSAIPLDDHRRNKVRQWLESRPKGKDMILDTASVDFYNRNGVDLSKIDMKKPTAIIPANVIWDSAALNRQIIFKDMIDWIAETIHWFERHSDYQLIIKSHPGELNPLIPATEERIETALQKKGIVLPQNVLLLPPLVNITVYQLFPMIKVGLMHTSTVGVEMVANKIPIIATGKSPYRGFGFSIDPTTREEYFKQLGAILSGNSTVDLEKYQDLAYKFILFNFYHYYTKIDIIDYSFGDTPKIKIHSLSELLPGKNKYRDYILDCIIQGIPIVDENRWPPES